MLLKTAPSSERTQLSPRIIPQAPFQSPRPPTLEIPFAWSWTWYHWNHRACALLCLVSSLHSGLWDSCTLCVQWWLARSHCHTELHPWTHAVHPSLPLRRIWLVSILGLLGTILFIIPACGYVQGIDQDVLEEQNEVMKKVVLVFEVFKNGLELRGAVGPSKGPQSAETWFFLTWNFVTGSRSLQVFIITPQWKQPKRRNKTLYVRAMGCYSAIKRDEISIIYFMLRPEGTWRTC